MNDTLKAHYPARKGFPVINLLRPYFGKDGEAYVTVGDKQVPFNPDATIVKRCVLTAAEWLEMDRVAMRAAKHRFRFIGKLMSHKLFDEEPNWRDEMELPFTHADAYYTNMLLAESRRFGSMDTVIVEAASRRVAEALEQRALGIDSLDWWKKQNPTQQVPKQLEDWPTMVGMFNHPEAIKVKMDNADMVSTAFRMVNAAVMAGFRGPFLFVHGSEFDPLLDVDYNWPVSARTVRDAIRSIERVCWDDNDVKVKVLDVMRADFLQDEFGLIQMTKDVVNVRVGQQLIPVQWSGPDNQLNIKVLAVMKVEFGKPGIVIAEDKT